MIEQFNDEDGWRWYGDKEHPENWHISVTKAVECFVPQKLKNYFVNNSKAKQEKTLTETADIGTAIHEAIKLDLRGEKPETKGIEKPFDNWLILKDKHKIKTSPAHTEVMVYSDEIGIGGTADIIGEFEGKICIMDIKTGFYGLKAGMQMAAYRLCALEKRLVSDGCGMVGLSIHRDGSVAKPLIYEHYEWCLKGFVACLELFKAESFWKLKKMNWKWLDNNSMKYLFDKSRPQLIVAERAKDEEK